jgi:hypothetical protein
VPRAKGPFIAGRKYKDLFDHERHWAYLRMRAQANFRNEEFELTQDEFFEFWTAELWPQRGRKPEDLCMVRDDVEKPWSKSNCLIVSRYQQLCRGKKMQKFKGYKTLD